MKRVLNRIRDIFKKKIPLQINTNSITVPEALGVREEVFNFMVNEMTNLIGEENRLLDFQNYIESPMFERHNIDLTVPNNLLLVGYAFAAAIFIRGEVKRIEASNNLLKELGNKVPSRES